MKQSQAHQILEYLKQGNAITPLDALRLFGCFRLSARIADLRDCGHSIAMARKNENGKTFAECRLNVPREASDV